MSDKPKLTMTNGAPVSDNQNVLTAGSRGPMLLRMSGSWKSWLTLIVK